MKFGWINIFGAVFVIMLIIPNILYAIKNKSEKNLCKNRFMNLIEQIGRYACVFLMWFPLFVWEFGFSGVLQMLIYIFGNLMLLIVYWVLFVIYMGHKTPALGFALAIIPACIFLLSGILLRHWLLVVFALVFAIGHIYVTKKNSKKHRINEI